MEKLLGLFEPYPLEYDLSGVFLFFVALLSLLVLLLVLPRIKLNLNWKTYRKGKNEETRISIKDPKKTAYQITFLIYKYQTPYNQLLLEKLERYKYRKTVEELDEQTKQLIQKFIEYVRRNYGRV